MLINNIKIGDRVEITLNSERAIRKTYVSQVENVLGNGELLLHMPISYGQIVKLPLSAKYSFLFFSERGMLKFDASILRYSKEDGFNLMTVKLLSKGERVQRREFFRYSIVQPIKFTIVEDTDLDKLHDSDNPNSSDDLGKETQEKTITGMTKDLGGGGVRFVCNESLEEGIKVKCFLTLGDDYLIAFGVILHKQVFPKSTYKYQYRIIFSDLRTAEQEKIVHFIFSEQRKSLTRKD